MALEDDIAILSRAPLFSLMDTEALRLIAFAAEHKLLRQGDVLFRRGDKADGGFVVTKGSLAVTGKDNAEPFVADPDAPRAAGVPVGRRGDARRARSRAVVARGRARARAAATRGDRREGLIPRAGHPGSRQAAIRDPSTGGDRWIPGQ
jgi:hypothetical protein